MIERNQKGKLFVISGPSGVGKGTVITELLENDEDLTFSVSVTTRKPRNNEVNGKDYIFISREEFENRIKNDKFLEWAEVHGELYGTPRKQIEEELKRGKKVILDIDVEGAKQIIKTDIPKKTIFIMPPSEEELIRRLRERKTNSEKDIKMRLNQAKNEIKKQFSYDIVVENDNLKETVSKIRDIIKKEVI